MRERYPSRGGRRNASGKGKARKVIHANGNQAGSGLESLMSSCTQILTQISTLLSREVPYANN